MTLFLGVLCCYCCYLYGVDATVDPPNATEIYVPNFYDNGKIYTYNVTHTYFRDYFINNNEVTFDATTRRCRSRDGRKPIVHYWLNELQLPARMRYYDERNRVYSFRNRSTIESTIDRIIQNLATELELEFTRVSRQSYYRTMDSLLSFPDQLIVSRASIPVEVHFRSKPYPQSTFMEFVTNRDVEWAVYNPRVYERRVGEDLDLFYRFRHNFRHTLGLGHLDDKASIMYPTNVRGQGLLYPIDIDAVHYLLCSRTVAYSNARENARPLSTTTRRYRPPIKLLSPLNDHDIVDDIEAANDSDVVVVTARTMENGAEEPSSTSGSIDDPIFID